MMEAPVISLAVAWANQRDSGYYRMGKIRVQKIWGFRIAGGED
jgi:hypothetical protein